MTKEQLRAQAEAMLKAAGGNIAELEKQAAADGSWTINDVMEMTALQISYVTGCLALASQS